MKRIVVLLVVAAMAISALIGCSPSSATTTQSPTSAVTVAAATQSPTAEPTPSAPDYLNLDSTYPLVNEGYDVTLKFVCVNQFAGIDPNNHWIWAHYEEFGNLNCDVKYYDAATWADQMNLLFTSQDLPDIFYLCYFTRDQLVRYGQVEGMFYDLTDVIAEYAPLTNQAFLQYPDAKAACMTPDGKMYTLPLINDDSVNYPLGGPKYFINAVWLDYLGLQNPETLDDLTNVLTAFKTGDPNQNGLADEIPFEAGYVTAYRLNAVVLTALGINSYMTNQSYVKEDGTIGFPFMQPQYADYLEYVKMLLDNGLLEEDFFTITNEQVAAKLATENAGVYYAAAPFAVVTGDSYKNYVSLNVLTSDVNTTKMMPHLVNRYGVGQFAVAFDTQYPELCARWADTHYTEDAVMIFWHGQNEGSDQVLDGWQVTSVTVDEDGVGTIIYPDEGAGIWDYLSQKVLPYYGGQSFGYGDYTGEIQRYFDCKLVLSDQENTWRNSYIETVVPYVKQMMPDLYYTAEQLDRKAALETPIFDYVDSMEAKYLMGTESIDDMTAFYSQLEALGIEEYMQIIQAAYEAYLANLGS